MINAPRKDTFVKGFNALRSLVYLQESSYAQRALENTLYVPRTFENGLKLVPYNSLFYSSHLNDRQLVLRTTFAN